MQEHDLYPNPGAHHRKRRVGRGTSMPGPRLTPANRALTAVTTPGSERRLTASE